MGAEYGKCESWGRASSGGSDDQLSFCGLSSSSSSRFLKISATTRSSKSFVHFLQTNCPQGQTKRSQIVRMTHSLLFQAISKRIKERKKRRMRNVYKMMTDANKKRFSAIPSAVIATAMLLFLLHIDSQPHPLPRKTYSRFSFIFGPLSHHDRGKDRTTT